jgi:phage tail sheath gpL-like
MIRIVAVLFCLVLISTSMMSGLYARYTVGAPSGDGAGVAAFIVDASIDRSDVNVTLTSAADGTASFIVTVENDSEVAVGYDLTLSATLPAGVTVTLDGASPILVGGKYYFADVGSLHAGSDVTANHALVFTADPDVLTQSADGAVHVASVTFTLLVAFAQID